MIHLPLLLFQYILYIGNLCSHKIIHNLLKRERLYSPTEVTIYDLQSDVKNHGDTYEKIERNPYKPALFDYWWYLWVSYSSFPRHTPVLLIL